MTQLEAQAAEARALLADLAAIGTDVDEETVTLVVEGETALVEAVASALVEAEMATAAAKATAELVVVLEARRERQLARAERIRSRIAQALGSLGLRKLSTAAGTVSVVASPARVIITDEGAIPSQWWRERHDYVLDKAGIRRELLAGEAIEGCTLSNRQDTIRVRT